jgi:hypothetical protein
MTDDEHPSQRREPHWLLNIVVASAVSLIVGGLLGPPLLKAARNAFNDVFHPQSAKDRVVDRYVRDLRRADIWSRPPTVFSDAVRYFRSHFTEFDPRRPHNFRETRHVPLLALVPTAPNWVTRPVVTAGNVISANQVSPQGGIQDWLLVLVPPSKRPPKPSDRPPIVTCRVPLPARTVVPPWGAPVIVRGLVLAAGDSVQHYETAYMVCTSAQILPPNGTPGIKPLPPDLDPTRGSRP